MQRPTVYSEQVQIDSFKDTAAIFVRDILGLKPQECRLSDESDLDDFSLSGGISEREHVSWDEVVISKIQNKYGITLDTTRVNLVWLFNQIDLRSKTYLH